ncbi:hypothetical protein F5Y10DRAFT_259347 [Nemania abortiva]|nr:hypothetical protein F5Y10DRAFT_259347 [Nemania abortiva]
MYKYNNHITTLAWAMAWFGDWPRTGIQFNNFFEAGLYQRNNSSYRCYNPLYVNLGHIVFEPALYNFRC